MHNDSKFSVEVSFLSTVVAAVEQMNEEFIEQRKPIIMMDIELKSFLSLSTMKRLKEWEITEWANDSEDSSNGMLRFQYKYMSNLIARQWKNADSFYFA